MTVKAVLIKRAADAICRLRASMDDQSSRKWEADLDLIELVIYSELRNALNDSVSTDVYLKSDPKTLSEIIPDIMARIDLLYCDLMEVGDK